jgi:hypothetical protein
VTALVAAAAMALPVSAQDKAAASRAPSTGLAILDCKPAAPAPEGSCLLRVPPKYKRYEMRTTAPADADFEFNFVRAGDEGFPPDVAMSGTVVLIDLSPQKARVQQFSKEKALIRRFVEGLPEDELVAVFGFNESLERLADFTQDRDEVLKAIDALTLRGSNTRIATFAKDAIRLLKQREDVLLKQLIIISDGDEEGIGAAAEVNSAAVDANVSVSSLGIFWRAFGAAENAKGMDYLRSMTAGSMGSSVMAQLSRPGEAETAVDDFLADLQSVSAESGLIVPTGTPEPADLIVVIQEPKIGSPGQYNDQEIRVQYTPVAGASGDADTAGGDDAEAGDMIMGYPAMWVYGAAGGAAVLLALIGGLIAFLSKRGGSKGNEFDAAAAEEGGIAFDAPESAPAPAKTEQFAPSAYLIRADSREKLPLSGNRIAVGRAPTNAVVLTHESVSRVHAELFRNRDGGYSVTDMDSLNGTYVNDRKISGPTPVSNGDSISFGRVKTKLALP